MKKVIATEKIPIKLWLDDIEEGALQQAKNLANLPFAFKHIALMPDSHQGYGMPIGGVLATQDVIIPNAVGVDIGCGMCAVKTSLTEMDVDTIKKIMSEIRKVIPVGFAHHKEGQGYMPVPKDHVTEIIMKEFLEADKQVGTLGGGNHFIEIQKGSGGCIWIMIHSGSRNFGFKTAHYYNQKAVELNEKWRSVVLKEQELAFLPLGEKLAEDYMGDMTYCVEFALANRKLMMDRILQVFPSCIYQPMINIAHNYAKLENHFGKNVIVHRKGATLARKDTVGIIPGSQGTKSYIVRGKENPDSFNSCSHGAGRKMGRNVARKTLSLIDEKKRLDDKGIIHAIRTEKDLDEASGAYKDISVVMGNQTDLVEIIEELEPLAVIKG